MCNKSQVFFYTTSQISQFWNKQNSCKKKQVTATNFPTLIMKPDTYAY